MIPPNTNGEMETTYGFFDIFAYAGPPFDIDTPFGPFRYDTANDIYRAIGEPSVTIKVAADPMPSDITVGTTVVGGMWHPRP